MKLQGTPVFVLTSLPEVLFLYERLEIDAVEIHYSNSMSPEHSDLHSVTHRSPSFLLGLKSTFLQEPYGFYLQYAYLATATN